MWLTARSGILASAPLLCGARTPPRVWPVSAGLAAWLSPRRGCVHTRTPRLSRPCELYGSIGMIGSTCCHATSVVLAIHSITQQPHYCFAHIDSGGVVLAAYPSRRHRTQGVCSAAWFWFCYCVCKWQAEEPVKLTTHTQQQFDLWRCRRCRRRRSMHRKAPASATDSSSKSKHCRRTAQHRHSLLRATMPQPRKGYKAGYRALLGLASNKLVPHPPSTLVRSKPVCLCDLVSRDEQHQGGRVCACTILFVCPHPSRTAAGSRQHGLKAYHEGAG